MKKFTLYFILFSTIFIESTLSINSQPSLTLTGIMDFSTPAGGLSGKAIQLTANQNISDLSVYGMGSANNGGGTDGQEYTFPSISINTGQHVIICRDSAALSTYFGGCLEQFPGALMPTIIIENSSFPDGNGNDALELFHNNVLIETFGQATHSYGSDCALIPWCYRDSWAWKDTAASNVGNWVYGGDNCSDNSSFTLTSSCPYPLCVVPPPPSYDDLLSKRNSNFNHISYVKRISNENSNSNVKIFGLDGGSSSFIYTSGTFKGFSSFNNTSLNDLYYSNGSFYNGFIARYHQNSGELDTVVFLDCISANVTITNIAVDQETGIIAVDFWANQSPVSYGSQTFNTSIYRDKLLLLDSNLNYLNHYNLENPSFKKMKWVNSKLYVLHRTINDGVKFDKFDNNLNLLNEAEFTTGGSSSSFQGLEIDENLNSYIFFHSEGQIDIDPAVGYSQNRTEGFYGKYAQTLISLDSNFLLNWHHITASNNSSYGSSYGRSNISISKNRIYIDGQHWGGVNINPNQPSNPITIYDQNILTLSCLDIYNGHLIDHIPYNSGVFNTGRFVPLKTMLDDDRLFVFGRVEGSVHIDKQESILVDDTYSSLIIEYDTNLNYQNHRLLETSVSMEVVDYNLALSKNGQPILSYNKYNLNQPFRFIDTIGQLTNYYDGLGTFQGWTSTLVKFDANISCPTPVIDYLSINSLNESSVSLLWDINVSNPNWNLKWGPTGGQMTTVPISSNTYSLNNLNSNTEYSLYAQVDCGNGDTSLFVGPLTFKTSCGPNDSSTGVDTQTACDSLTWIDGVTYTSSNNTATYTLTNAVGCDSVVTLDLTINYSNSGIDTITACDSYTWIDGITYTSSNNTATHTLTNAAGCDSVVTLDLTINYSTTGTDLITACDSLTWIDGVTYTSSNNTATHTLTNAVSCDSVVTLDLTINYSTTGTDLITACDSLTWIDGVTYTSSNNTATHTLTNAVGCDSVVTLDLTIYEFLTDFSESSSLFTGPPFVVQFTNNTPSLTNYNFSWDFGDSTIEQNNNASVFHEYMYNGLYDVTLIAEDITNGCGFDTLKKEDLIYCAGGPNLSIIEFSNNINVFPNPTTENINIIIYEFNGNIQTEVFDLIGNRLQSTNETTISLQDYARGIYFLKVAYGGKVEEVKVVKE